MPITLNDIVEAKRRWLYTTKQLPASAEGLPMASGAFEAALKQPGCALIAEIKPKSPSAGVLVNDLDLQAIIQAYGQYADAISVLTDEPFFKGSFDTLHQASSSSGRPTLCKDFILDARQLWKARQCGAEAALLIVKILDPEQLLKLHAECLRLGMTPVVEVQNSQELGIALSCQPRAVLVNNRDLSTFEMDMQTSHRLLPSVPPGIIKIAASGYKTETDLKAIQSLADAVLMGSHLMPLAKDAQRLNQALLEVRTALCANREH